MWAEDAFKRPVGVALKQLHLALQSIFAVARCLEEG